uniref:Uncharacterized protein n=1 Tax=Anguilla anguilla TaxID=7936 RepID=A0A0E9U6B6_ANGAN
MQNTILKKLCIMYLTAFVYNLHLYLSNLHGLCYEHHKRNNNSNNNGHQIIISKHYNKEVLKQ